MTTKIAQRVDTGITFFQADIVDTNILLNMEALRLRGHIRRKGSEWVYTGDDGLKRYIMLPSNSLEVFTPATLRLDFLDIAPARVRDPRGRRGGAPTQGNEGPSTFAPDPRVDLILQNLQSFDTRLTAIEELGPRLTSIEESMEDQFSTLEAIFTTSIESTQREIIHTMERMMDDEDFDVGESIQGSDTEA
ncbi:PREDICTED: uncharacterized protein LOC104809781 [Tarenaya hassleriana]|uniref:uncharacterized protein LOC104809781 n=1 Tax=Tarenaya hassleriana TaxID=28532 RepID=UPI00053C08B4|nr:PREDICTED: uncharacterized protein LOC104809781 [Tarenaya hassleriana]